MQPPAHLPEPARGTSPRRSGRLILNPTLRIQAEYFAAIKGGTQAEGRLDDEDLVRAVWRTVFTRLDAKRVRDMQRRGILVSEDRAPRPVSAYPVLPGCRSSLFPASSRERRGLERRELVVNPRCVLQRPEDPFPEQIQRLLPRFERPTGPILWIRHPGSELIAPYQLPPPALERVMALLGGQGPDRLDAQSRRTLSAAGLLLAAGSAKNWRAEWSKRLEIARRTLQTQRFVVLRGVLPPAFIAAARRYVRALETEGHFRWSNGSTQPRTSPRKFIHNDALCRLIHVQLTRLLNLVVPERVKPSYSYLCAYPPKAVLERHRDRAQCAWNVSMPLDARPELPREKAWPIYLETAGQAHEVRLELGDAVLYRGTDIWHWRNAQPAAHRSTICFFHFVRKGFRGRLD